MAISIRNARTEALARDVAARTGETMTEAITNALEERLRRLRTTPEHAASVRSLLGIARRIARRRTRDNRSAEQILGYDKRGLPR